MQNKEISALVFKVKRKAFINKKLKKQTLFAFIGTIIVFCALLEDKSQTFPNLQDTSSLFFQCVKT